MVHLNVSGYPGAGKTTIFNLFLNKFPETIVVPKITTRPKRVNEGNLEYLFVSQEEFFDLQDRSKIVGVEKIIQKGIPYFYGIPTKELWPIKEGNIFLSLFGEHAPEIRDKYFPSMKLFFLSLKNKKLLESRLRERCILDGSDFESRKKLMDMYLSLNLEDKYDFVVYNDNTPEMCLEEIYFLLKKENQLVF